VAEPALTSAHGPTPVTQRIQALQQQVLVRLSDRLGVVALFACAAALLCAWIPKLCGLVIPLAIVGAFVGLSGLVLVLSVAQQRLLLPIAAAAGPVVFLLAAWFFPVVLGPAYMASRAKGSVDPTAIRAVPIEGSFNSSSPLDPEWVDATKASLQLGQVNVQVMNVSIRRAEAVKSVTGKRIPPGNYCFVRIRTQEQVAASQFSVNRSQSRSSPIEDAALTLTGIENRNYELHGVLKVEAVDKQRKGLAFPVSFQDHVFLFEAPAARPDHLRLEIAADAWGGEGAFRFTIPRSMITDERGKPGRS
jgi:hypothetical protein